MSFRIQPGEVVALVGHSGAGKSTLIDLLLRFYQPQEGVIRLDGRDIRYATLESLRSQIGVVPQHTVLFVGTVAENIAYGKPDATREEIERAAQQAHAHEFIERLPDGYDTLIGDRACACREARRSGLPSPAHCYATRRSWCWTRRLRRWILCRSASSSA